MLRFCQPSAKRHGGAAFAGWMRQRVCKMNHQELSEWDIYNLGRYARHAAEGWFYIELAPDSDGNRCLGLVHEDVPWGRWAPRVRYNQKTMGLYHA